MVDKNNRFLIRYILDLEIAKQTWWSVDEITATWYPHPVLEATDTSTNNLVTPYPALQIEGRLETQYP